MVELEQRVNEGFEPEKYEDVVRSRMMEVIQQKIDGQEIATPAAENHDAKIVDLMEALKASVGDKKGRKAAPKRNSAARAGRKGAATKAKSTSKRKS